MLNLTLTPAYWWPVEYTQPADGGVANVQAFEANYRQLDDDDYTALVQKAAVNRLGDRDVVREVLLGFRSVVDGAGAPVEATPESTDALLRLPGMATQLWLTYTKSRSDAALGNLPRPQAGGPAAATANATTPLRH